MSEFTPSNSNPYLSISKHYDVDYDDLLMYADFLQQKFHGNDAHILPAVKRMKDNKNISQICKHVAVTISKINPSFFYVE